MANIFQQGSDWLVDQLGAHATIDVIYQQDAEQIPVKATIGRTIFEQTDAYGVIQKIESRDYLIQTTHLQVSNTPILPKRGDRIRESFGDLVAVYEVMAPGKEPHWRYSDPFRKLLRIHTKHVATEEV